MEPRCAWRYLFLPENSNTPPATHPAVPCLLRAAKALIWLGISILFGLGLGQLA